MVPWFERPINYDVRARAHQVTSVSGSKDLQMVNLSIRVLTRPDVGKLPDIYRNLGTDFNERVLPSIIHETLKSVVAGSATHTHTRHVSIPRTHPIINHITIYLRTLFFFFCKSSGYALNRCFIISPPLPSESIFLIHFRKKKTPRTSAVEAP